MKNSITILIAFILSISIYAQNTPEKFTYQAVVRNADNTLAISQDVGIRISILKTTSSGTVVYKETQSKTTNANGLLTIKIGEGDNKTGSISSIDWGADKYYIKTEIDLANGTSYPLTDTPTQLLSVPYALHAKTADNVTTYTAGNGIDITGNAIAVKPATTNSGLTATTDGLKVKLAATDPGLAFDSNGGLKANSVAYTADTDGSIIVANSKIKVNAGDGLTSNSTDGLKVKLAATNPGLSVDADGLKVKGGLGLTTDSGGLRVNAGDGIAFQGTTNIGAITVKLDATNPGLSVATTGLKVKTDETTGSGLSVATTGLKVKTDETTGSGLSVATTGLKVKTDETTGSGLTTTTGGLKVKTGDGLTVDASNGLQVKTGSGITIDGTGAITTEPTYAIGNKAFGGYVFDIFDNGKHGWVVASQDQAGTLNTKIDYRTAQRSCDIVANFDTDGRLFHDWHLPTFEQLNKLFKSTNTVIRSKMPIPPTTAFYYWSSQLYGEYSVTVSAGNTRYAPVIWLQKFLKDFLTTADYNKYQMTNTVNGKEEDDSSNPYALDIRARCVRSF